MVNNPMCRFNMMLRGDDSDDGQFGHVSKETIWMTNAEEIAKELQGSVKTIFQEQNPIDIAAQAYAKEIRGNSQEAVSVSWRRTMTSATWRRWLEADEMWSGIGRWSSSSTPHLVQS